jgi:hypothetical protein
MPKTLTDSLLGTFSITLPLVVWQSLVLHKLFIKIELLMLTGYSKTILSFPDLKTNFKKCLLFKLILSLSRILLILIEPLFI